MVEWKKLGDFAMLQKNKNRKHVTENAYSITQAGLVPTKSFFKEKTNITSNDTSGYYIVEKDWFVYSPSRIDVGSISFLKDDGPVIVSPIDVVFSIDKKVCLPSYLLNYFFTYQGRKDLLKNREGVEGTGRRSLPFSAIENMLIPVPLLQEQEQIVKTLDTFTSSIENLKEQIAQRRKQYEYYRDQLLNLEGNEGVEIKTLGEILKSLKTGLNPRKNFVLNAPGSDCFYITVRELGVFDVVPQENTDRVTSEALRLINNRSNLEVGDVLFSGTGTIGRTALIKEEPTNWNIKEGVYTLKPRQEIIISSFLVQLLHANCIINKISALVVGDPIRSVPMKSLVTITIPIPSLSEQQRIVSILDTFEASVRNLEQQLAQREKQYEYYRNKLLTFE